jgi:hypothetical protein
MTTVQGWAAAVMMSAVLGVAAAPAAPPNAAAPAQQVIAVNPYLLPLVQKLLYDPSGSRREDAAEDLERVGDPSCIPALQWAAVNDCNGDVRKHSARAIERIYRRYPVPIAVAPAAPIAFAPPAEAPAPAPQPAPQPAPVPQPEPQPIPAPMPQPVPPAPAQPPAAPLPQAPAPIGPAPAVYYTYTPVVYHPFYYSYYYPAPVAYPIAPAFPAYQFVGFYGGGWGPCYHRPAIYGRYGIGFGFGFRYGARCGF